MHRDANRRPLPTYGAALLAAGAALTLGMVLSTVSEGVHPDFIGLHTAARELATGRPLYSTVVEGTENLNPPLVALIMWPLAWLDVGPALAAWWVVCLASAWLSVRLWNRVLPRPYSLILLGVILVTPAGYAAVRFGAWTWPLTVLSSLAWIAFRGGDRAKAGALLGVLAALRVFALLFVPYLVWKREWRTLGYFAAVFAAAGAIGLGVCGTRAYADWVSVLSRITVYGDFYNGSLMGFSQRLVGDWLGLAEYVTPIWMLSGAIVALAAWRRLTVLRDVDVEWAAVLVSCLLFSPLGWSYYLSIAAAPVAVLAARGQPWRFLFAWVWFLIPWTLVEPMLSSGNHVMLMSLQTFGTFLLLYACLSTLRPVPATSRSHPSA